jgi:cytochrome c-type biogenesis protein CcmH/NrfG
MKLFDGLYLYEIVLLALGVVFFVVLLIAFLRLVFQGKPFGALLMFFGISVVMIGYPSIKAIEIGKDTIKIEKYTQELKENPTNSAVRAELAKVTTRVAARPFSSAQRVVAVASAQFALGGESAAIESLAKARKLDPAAPAVLELQKRIEIVRNLDRLASDAEKRPNDPGVKAELTRTLAEATQLKFANPKSIAVLAKAQAVVGHEKQALENAEKALAIDPKAQAARDVKTRIQSTRIQPQPNP